MTNNHYLAELGAWPWHATDIICQTDRGKYTLAASLDGKLWDAEFTGDDRRIQSVAAGLESFDAAREACAEHYAKLKATP